MRLSIVDIRSLAYCLSSIWRKETQSKLLCIEEQKWILHVFDSYMCILLLLHLGNRETKVFVFVLKMDNNFCLNFVVAFAYLLFVYVL